MTTLKVVGISAIIICALGTIIGVQLGKIERLQEDNHQLVNFAKTDSSKVTYYESALKTQVARTNQVILSYNNLQALRETDRLAWVQQFDGIKKNLKNLETATTTTARLVANFKIPLGDTTIILPDSTAIQARTFNNGNKWIQLTGVVTNDTVQVTPVVVVPLQEVQYWQRKKFLFLRIGKKEYFSDITSANPYVKITGHEVIRAGRKRK